MAEMAEEEESKRFFGRVKTKRESLFALSKVVNPDAVKLSDASSDEQKEIKAFLCEHGIFGVSPGADVPAFFPFIWVQHFQPGDWVFGPGSESDRVYVVYKGAADLVLHGHWVLTFHEGTTFGEVGFMEQRLRRGAVRARNVSTMLHLRKQELLAPTFPRQLVPAVLMYMAKRLTNLLQGGAAYRSLDVLIVQDGGCSPGYNPVTGYLSEYFDACGHRVFAARTGFKSLVNGDADSEFSMLVNDVQLFNFLSGVPNVVFARPLMDMRGAMFRTERFPGFKEPANQQKAADIIKMRKVKVLVCVGGNGTFFGTRELCKYLPKDVKVFFVPATIDSDVYGTETLGQHTAVEAGADKLKCYLADARTHHRCYIVEMMGRDGGFHCLHSCLGAGAHLAVLPDSKLDLAQVAVAITARKDTVIAVAEGYGRDERTASGFEGNAAQYLLSQLRKTGKLDESKRKVVTEPFSRDIRGALPNNLDIILARKMAKMVVRAAEEGKSHLMPTVNAGEQGYMPFDQINTCNTVEMEDVDLANRLQLWMTTASGVAATGGGALTVPPPS